MATMRRLNYQHLLYFWSVVKTGSLTRACQELSLSAPTISMQLRTLEERLGEKLLAKSGRALVPTESGCAPKTRIVWRPWHRRSRSSCPSTTSGRRSSGRSTMP